MSDRNLWERQEYETDTAFHRFHKYYLAQDPPRSVEEAYRQWRNKTHAQRTSSAQKKADGTWKRWAWPDVDGAKSWAERAAAWDDHLASLRQAEWEERHMSASEAMARLADMARGDLADFSDVLETGKLTKSDLSHIIKKLKVTKKAIVGNSENSVEETRIEIELNDPQSALRDILKINGMFVDKVEHSGEVKQVTAVEVVRPKSDE